MKTCLKDVYIANNGLWLDESKVGVKTFLNSLSEIPEGRTPIEMSKLMVEKLLAFKIKGNKDKEQQKKSITGKFFELLMAELLVKHKITPFYIQATLRYVPLSRFDFLCYDNLRPIVFSTKISLAERWRQAAYEGDLLKKVYRKGECFLVTANKNDADKCNERINKDELVGIDKCFVMGEEDLVLKLEELSSRVFSMGEKVHPVVKGKFVDRR